MKYFEIDLYDHYKVEKPKNGRAYAFCSFREAEPVCLKYFALRF